MRQTWVQFPDPRLKVKRILKNPLIWIFLLALILRIYKLGTFPFGFHVDEVKVGWEALSILTTGKDDHGNFLSPYYNSIGDFRPTGIFYFTIPSLIIFGRTELAVRLPSAIFGALTILPIFYFAFEILQKKKWAYVASFLLAISPWHIEVSRATSEVVISTFFAIFSLYFLTKLIRTTHKKYLFFCIFSITLSYFLYHAIRLLAPPFFLTTILFFNKELRSKIAKKYAFICLTFTLLFSLALTISPQGRQRFNQVSIFKDIDINYEIERIRSENTRKTLSTLIFDNKAVIYTRRFLEEYSTYFSGSFLIGNAARPYRYATPGIGLLGYVEIVLLVIGLLEVVKGKRSLLPLLLILIAPLPAAVTTEDAPNLHRAFLMLPFIIILEAYGFEKIVDISKNYKKRVQILILVLLTINLTLFLHMYFSHSLLHKPYLKDLVLDGSSYRNVGTKELALQIEKIKGNYDRVIITNQPDSIYPWYAFFTNKDPKEFNRFEIQSLKGPWQYQNITFSQNKCPSDDSFIDYPDENILVIDSQDCPYESKIRDGLPIKVENSIKRPDGTLVYALLVKTGPIPEKFLRK